MRKLNKKQAETFERHRSDIEAVMTELEEAIEVCNEAIAVAVEPVELALLTLNEQLNSFNAWREEIAGDMEMYYDDRSERWQDSDAGNEYSEWTDVWGQPVDDEIEVDNLDELTLDMPVVEPPSEDSYPQEAGGW